MPERADIPLITTVTVVPAEFGPGEYIDVEFTTTGAFYAGNIFTAQLSNMVGDFTNARTLGSMTATSQGVIGVRLPCDLGAGTGFRIRVVASAPRIFGPDNGTPLTIKARPVFEVAASGPTTFCPGGSVVLSATPGYLFYRWNTGDTSRSIVVRNAGIYTVNGWDVNECGLVSRATVILRTPPNPPIRLRNGIVLETDFGYASYVWKLDSVPIPDSNWPTLKVEAYGSYTVTVSDSEGCTGTSPAKKLPVASAVPETGAGASVGIAMSGDRNRLSIETVLGHDEAVAIAVSDVSGREVLRREESAAAGPFRRDVPADMLPPGVYLVRVMIGERIVMRKVVKGG